MNSERKIAIIAGVLFITATVAGILSVVFTGPIPGTPDYLSKLFANESEVKIGALFELIMAFAGASISISLYPVLRKYNEGLALGAVGFRIMEAVIWIADVICLLLLLTLSREFIKAGVQGHRTFKPQALYYWQYVIGRTS